MSACDGKLRWTWRDAHQVALWFRRRHDNEIVVEYRCPACRWWHVGHVMRRKGR